MDFALKFGKKVTKIYKKNSKNRLIYQNNFKIKSK